VYEKTSFNKFLLVTSLMTEMMFGPNWTGLDRFFVVQSGFFEFCHNKQPVFVAVRPNKAKKPD
jgi:hypothetical protein